MSGETSYSVTSERTNMKFFFMLRVQILTLFLLESNLVFSSSNSTEKSSPYVGFVSLLADVLREVTQCSLLIVYDRNNGEMMETIVKGEHFSSLTKSVYSLDELTKKTREDSNGTSEAHPLEMYKVDVCEHYLLLVEEEEDVQRTLEALYEHRVQALEAHFIIVTEHTSWQRKLKMVQAKPLDRIKDLLLINPMKENSDTWQLYTHDFFTQNKQRIALKSIGKWRDKKLYPTDRKKPSKYFPDKLKNFNGFKFRVSTFHYPPVVEMDSADESLHDGLEVRIMKTIAEALNLTIKLEAPRDGQKWGSATPNGTWSGAMGEVKRGEADVSFANYFITRDRLSIVDMTSLHSIDYACFITPMPNPPPQYSAVVWPFQSHVWLTLLLVLLVMPLVLRLAGVYELQARHKWFRGFGNCVLNVWAVQMNQSTRQNVLPQTNSLRTAFIFFSVSAFVISVAYRSSLFSFLLVPAPPQPVNSLEELLSSGLQWGVRDRGGWESWFSDSTDPKAQKVYEGFQFVKGINGGIERVLEGDFAFMNSGRYLRYLVASNFTDMYGQAELHIAKECFVPFRIGFATPLHSVYTNQFSEEVNRIVEAGLVTKWFNDLVSKAAQKKRERSISHSTETVTEETSKALDLKQLQGAFFTAGVGLLLSLLSFAAEILTHKAREKERE